MFKRKYSPPRRACDCGYRPDLLEYERLKGRWLADHPVHTPEEYQRAMRTIAARCGI